MSATWRKEKSAVETSEIMKTAAHRSESWCWHQLHAADTCSNTQRVPFPCVKTQTSNSTSVHYWHDVMSSTREDVIRRRYVLLRCADSSLNHEWSKIAAFVSCLDAVGVRPPLWFICLTLYLRLLSVFLSVCITSSLRKFRMLMNSYFVLSLHHYYCKCCFLCSSYCLW
jgi:hypothetical protein